MEPTYMESNSRLEALVTHVTGVLFVLLGVATWLLRWLVAGWIAQAQRARQVAG